MGEVPDIIKSRVRAFLLSCTNHKEPMRTFEVNYGKLYKKLNLKELGFDNLQEFMSSIPDAVSIQREGSLIMLVGIPTQQNKHIVDMIEKQKKPKKRPMRDSMILPRFQTGGSRTRSGHLYKVPYSKPLPKSIRPPRPPPINDAFQHPADFCRFPFPGIPANAILPPGMSSFSPFQIAYQNNPGGRFYRPPANRYSQPAQPSYYMHRPAPSPAAPIRPYAPPKPSKAPAPLMQDRMNRLSMNERPPSSNSTSSSRLSMPERLGPPMNNNTGSTRLSVKERLGPPVNNSTGGMSSLEKARRRVEAAREAAAREKEAMAQQQQAVQQKPIESSKPRSFDEFREPLEIRIDGDERKVTLKSPAVSEPPKKESRVIVLKDPADFSPSIETAICEVDSDGTSDESFEFPVDADFLRMLVLYVISEADTCRNWVSASGLGSRMRRRLAKAGVETPPAIAESILKFMQYEWKDMFDVFSGDDRGDCCHLNTPFQFCENFRDAYSSQVEPLVTQMQPGNDTLSVRIVHVEAPAFFVRLVNESEEMFVAISEELGTEFLSSESPTDVFTYRKNEMCAVCIELESARVWRRGRLEAFTLLGDELDEQTSELTAFVKVFLVDSGETVNVRAGDVRRLPRRFYATQALAYRCVFQGARLEDSDTFDRMLRKYVNELVELQVHGDQISDGLMTLQARITADSYLLDELVYAKVATRVTCADPDPASFPPDANVEVLWLAWRENCRAALVKLDSPEQKQRLFDLEVKLSEAVVGQPRATRLIENNIYVWRRPSELSRRVRFVSVPGDGPVQVFCVDHGCNCHVTPGTDLCLPTSTALKSLMSGTHYFTSVLRLALLPPSEGPKDVVRKGEPLWHRIQGLCDRKSAFTARHETLISESPSFMLYPREEGAIPGSLNCALLSLLLDMRFWPNMQNFCARMRPLPDINPLLSPSLANSQCLVLRMDAANCQPAFEAHGREYRYLQRCCLDFTAKGADSVMCRLCDLPANTVLQQGTRLVYRQIDDSANASLMCRVELIEDFVSGGGASSVDIAPIDDPLLSLQMSCAPPELLFTVPVECFGARPLERFSDDLEPKELELFCELLQHLPAVDQLAITIATEILDPSEDVAMLATYTKTTSVQNREFPLISLNRTD